MFLAGLHLTGALPEEIDTVYSFCGEIGLPVTFAEIGIDLNDRASLIKVAEKACGPEQSIHHEAGEMTPEKVLNAMIMADAYGRKKKLK